MNALMEELEVRVPDRTHRIAALAALRYRQADNQLPAAAVDELTARLEDLAERDDRQELLDALVSLSSFATMLEKLGDRSAHSIVMEIIRRQAHWFEDLGRRVIAREPTAHPGVDDPTA